MLHQMGEQGRASPVVHDRRIGPPQRVTAALHPPTEPNVFAVTGQSVEPAHLVEHLTADPEVGGAGVGQEVGMDRGVGLVHALAPALLSDAVETGQIQPAAHQRPGLQGGGLRFEPPPAHHIVGITEQQVPALGYRGADVAGSIGTNPGSIHDPDPLIKASPPTQQRPRRVVGRVVHHDDLVGPGGALIQQGPNLLLNGVGRVVDRHDYRNLSDGIEIHDGPAANVPVANRHRIALHRAIGHRRPSTTHGRFCPRCGRTACSWRSWVDL